VAAARDAATVAEFVRVFGARVARIYEGLRDRRGYGHPLMEGRYNGIRTPGEIVTIARAMAQMVGMGFEPIPAMGEDDASKPASWGRDTRSLTKRVLVVPGPAADLAPTRCP